MRHDTIKRILIIMSLVLAAEVVFMCVLITMETNRENQKYIPSYNTVYHPVTQPTQPATEETTAPTEQTLPVEETTEPTQPQPETFLLTFAGDCTLGAEPSWFSGSGSFISTIGTDYDYPFANVRTFFENDDFTMINLEGVLAEDGNRQDKTFTFRGPLAYTQIMTGSSVEAVTLANNHSFDFGQKGYDSTKNALDEAGISYVEEDKIRIFTTERGLKIGLYADAFQFSVTQIQQNIARLKEAGAEVIVCAFHWGEEGSYRATQSQKEIAHAALDAGAHIVYGHHPHVLQQVEQTENGVIFYSLGNFSFGGNSNPRDKDSAVMQQQIIREPDGTIRLGELNMIPTRISSVEHLNNYQPTPYEEGTAEYDRTMEKLLGTFTGPDLVVNYQTEDPTEPETTEPTTEQTQPSESPVETEPTTPETNPPEQETPPDQGTDGTES